MMRRMPDVVRDGGEGLYLQVLPPDAPPFEAELAPGRVTIGRSRDNGVPVPDASLSRHHAVVRVEADGAWLEDLGSRNGTWLNGQRVAGSQRLAGGDRIQLGGTDIEVRRRAPVSLRPGPAAAASEPSAVVDVTRFATTGRRLEFADVAAENRALSLVSRASALLIAHRPLPEIFDAMLALALEAFDADRAAVALVPSPDAEPAVAAARGRSGPAEIRLSRTVVADVLAHARAIAVVDVESDPRVSTAQSVRLAGVNSLMCAPLWNGATVAGVLYVDRRMARGDYAENDLKVLALLANVVAIKIENARLVEEAMAKQRYEEELRVAARIQRRLMPDRPPAASGLDVHGLCRSCSEIGGDFFDFHVLPDGRLALVVADICGKGVAGALLAASVQAAIRGGIRYASPPAERVASLNRYLLEHAPVDRFVTAAWVEIDPATGEVASVCAGHPPPVVVRADGRTEKLQEGGVPLGLVPDAAYECGHSVLAPGDRLLLYTDGVLEASPAGRREPAFGADGLAAAAAAAPTAEAACREVFEALDRFTEGAALRDDATAVVVVRQA